MYSAELQKHQRQTEEWKKKVEQLEDKVVLLQVTLKWFYNAASFLLTGMASNHSNSGQMGKGGRQQK